MSFREYANSSTDDSVRLYAALAAALNWRSSPDKLLTSTNVRLSRVYLSGLIEPMSQIQDIRVFTAGRVAMTHEIVHVSTTTIRSTSARAGSHLTFDGRRWRANLTSVGERAPDARTLSALRTTWYRSKHWRPWDDAQLGIGKGSRR